MLNENILKNEEKVAYSLRGLYESYGYSRYKMSKFEEYDLYVRNKDFLISQGIITFTDTNGKLLALKPDVTLSIIKNSTDSEGIVQKLYYDEKVYRTSKDSHSFKEIAQTGLECIGDIGAYDICEVLCLAVKSLEKIDENYILDICHAGISKAVAELCGFDSLVKKKVFSAIESKNADELDKLFACGEIDAAARELSRALIGSYRDADAFRSRIYSLTDDRNIRAAADEFSFVYDIMKKLGIASRLNIDFSIIDAKGYYSGVAFKGYIKGIPTNVLSGGQYDTLMKKMGKKQKAIGFAVYLDTLERHNEQKKQYDYDCVILKDSLSDAAEILSEVERLSSEGKRVCVAGGISEDMKYERLIDMRKGETYGNA